MAPTARVSARHSAFLPLPPAMAPAEPEREPQPSASVVSPSVFDLLSAADAAGLALFTPPPQRRAARPPSAASSPAGGSRPASAASSPSQFFRSPVRARKPRTPSAASGRPPTTPSPSARRLQRSRRPRTPVRPLEVRVKEEPAAEASTASFWSPPRRAGAAATPKRPLAALFRTPSPPSRQSAAALTRRLKDEFDEADLLDAGAARRNSLDSAPDDLFSATPTSLNGIGDHDAFFSFENALSPLGSTEDFLSVKMSPVGSLSSFDLQRLLPPYPASRRSEENDAAKSNASPAKAATETDDDVTLLLRAEFPNIRASTTAAPGKTERSKIGRHSTIKMRLHSPFGSASSFSNCDFQAINNSLNRKSHNRKRKLEGKKSSGTNVQRKLLQTPVKSPSTPIRSPRNDRATGTTLSSAVSESEVEEKSDTPAQQPTPQKTPQTTTGKRKVVGEPENPYSQEKQPVTPANKIQKVSESSTISGAAVGTTTPSIHRASEPPVANASVSSFSNAFQTPAKMYQTPVKRHSAVATPPPFITSIKHKKKGPCNCKKSKCLKLYCECFATGSYCDEKCKCVGCSNTPISEPERQEAIKAKLAKNPNAFKPKIGAKVVLANSAAPATAASASSGTPQLSPGASTLLTPVGTQRLLHANSTGIKKMHKNGCHCKRSSCQKRYCECYQAGVACGDNCRCIDCKNQTPCVTHASPAVSTPSAITPSRDIDETFVSPVLQGIRKRLRIDRETWTKNFSSPFESSPTSLRERTERFRSRLQAVKNSSTPLTALVAVSTSALAVTEGTSGSLTVRLKPADSSTSPPSTPKRVSFAALGGPVSPLRETASKAPVEALIPSSKAREMETADHASKSNMKQLEGRGLVFVLPLFGSNLPPLKTGVTTQIFRFLTNADLHNASLVNRLWSQLALGDSVWDHANFIPAGPTVGEQQADEQDALVSRVSTAK